MVRLGRKLQTIKLSAKQLKEMAACAAAQEETPNPHIQSPGTTPPTPTAL
jgi:hypothetical protein